VQGKQDACRSIRAGLDPDAITQPRLTLNA